MSETSNVNTPAPLPPKQISDLGLSEFAVISIAIKTMFRLNITTPIALSKAMRVSVPITSDIIQKILDLKYLEKSGEVQTQYG